MNDKAYKPIFSIHILSCLCVLIPICGFASRNDELVWNYPLFLLLLAVGLLSYSIAWFIFRKKNKNLKLFLYSVTCLLGSAMFAFILEVYLGIKNQRLSFEFFALHLKVFLFITKLITVLVLALSYSLQVLNHKLDTHFTKLK